MKWNEHDGHECRVQLKSNFIWKFLTKHERKFYGWQRKGCVASAFYIPSQSAFAWISCVFCSLLLGKTTWLQNFASESSRINCTIHKRTQTIFSMLAHKFHDFRRKVMLNIFWRRQLSTFRLWFATVYNILFYSLFYSIVFLFPCDFDTNFKRKINCAKVVVKSSFKILPIEQIEQLFCCWRLLFRITLISLW